MNILAVIGRIGAFFNTVEKRIICSIAITYVKCIASVNAGRLYWRGRVVGGGEFGAAGVGQQGGGWRYAEKFASKHGLGFREAAALFRLAVGLPGKTKGGGALGGAGVFDGQQVEKRLHVSAPINRPRGRVLVVGFNGVVCRNGSLCQLVVDAPQKVESVFSMPR